MFSVQLIDYLGSKLRNTRVIESSFFATKTMSNATPTTERRKQGVEGNNNNISSTPKPGEAHRDPKVAIQ